MIPICDPDEDDDRFPFLPVPILRDEPFNWTHVNQEYRTLIFRIYGIPESLLVSDRKDTQS